MAEIKRIDNTKTPTGINLNKEDFEDYKSYKKEYDRQYSILKNKRRREIYALNKEYKQKQAKEYRQNNPELFEKYNETRLTKYQEKGSIYKRAIKHGWKKAGIKVFDNTFDDYLKQDVCELCSKKFGEVGGKSRHNKKALDHDHRSGYARFICCYTCNTFLRGRDHRLAEVHLELYRRSLR